MSAGRAARLTLIASSSPAPSPVRLSPGGRSTGPGRLVVEEDEVGVRVDLALRVDRDRRGVEVEVRAGGGADVPAEAHGDGRQARSLLGERDVATLGQAYSHCWESFLVAVRASYWGRSYRYLYERQEGYRRFQVTLLSLPKMFALPETPGLFA